MAAFEPGKVSVRVLESKLIVGRTVGHAWTVPELARCFI